MSISVIIPTVGRSSLQEALLSCETADEIVLVLDLAKFAGKLPDLSGCVVVESVEGGDNGYTARTRGMQLATGTHLAFLDDDDVFTPGAIELMRAAACDRPVIFRMDHYAHGILWRDREVRFGNVSTQMFIVPNDPARLGVWEPHMPGLQEPGGDFTFLAGCVAKMGDPVWREEIVSVLRPHRRPPSVAIVTPWMGHLDLWPDYEQAVAVRRPGDELIIIDNGTVPPLPFGTIGFDENLGFSGASNEGLSAAKADAVLFLNNDIAATDPGWLDAIRSALEPGVLVGAQLRHDPHGSVDGHQLPYLDGWCVAGMRDDLLELGGFDDTFDEPSYYGDNDLSLRARAAGMALREVRVGLRHKLNGTTSPSDPRTQAATAANRARFEARARELLTEEVAA